MEILACISFLLGASWDFFTEIKVPGTMITFAQLFVGLFLASLGLRFLASMLGMTISSHGVCESASVVRSVARRAERKANSR